MSSTSRPAGRWPSGSATHRRPRPHPRGAIESFAGVGYFLDLAAIDRGEAVLDLGSGSGTDSFLAALADRREGRVIGIDMTEAQLAKAPRLAGEAASATSTSASATSSSRRSTTAAIDCVISNGVINLSPDKPAVFAAAARAAARRTPGAGRHRHGDPASRGRHLRRLALGRVHRWSDAARRLPRAIEAPASRSRPGARTGSTGSCPSGPTTRRRSTASRASRCSRPPQVTASGGGLGGPAGAPASIARARGGGGPTAAPPGGRGTKGGRLPPGGKDNLRGGGTRLWGGVGGDFFDWSSEGGGGGR